MNELKFVCCDCGEWKDNRHLICDDCFAINYDRTKITTPPNTDGELAKKIIAVNNTAKLCTDSYHAVKVQQLITTHLSTERAEAAKYKDTFSIDYLDKTAILIEKQREALRVCQEAIGHNIHHPKSQEALALIQPLFE